MDEHGNGAASADLDEVVTAYLKAEEAGDAPDRAEWLARHPALAAELAAFFADQDRLDRLTAPVRQVVGVRPAEAAAPLAAGARLGDFRIVREVGRGGMAVVYEAEQVSLQRRVALKVLPFAATLDPKRLLRFQNEARAAGQLHHTNIVPVFAVGCERGLHYYAMQFIDGQTLAALIDNLRVPAASNDEARKQKDARSPFVPAQHSALSTQHCAISTEHYSEVAGLSDRPARGKEYYQAVARLGVQAAEALDYAHQLGVVHRDVKPANLMVDGRGSLWITDFGLAQIQSDVALTQTGDLMGTLRYMSPEQARAKRGLVDHRTDVYALGVTVYELLTLRPAFAGQDRPELLRQIAWEEPVRPRRLEKAIPAELETIVLKAMDKNPADRYATAQELAADLRRFLDHLPVHARRPSLWRRLAKWARRHRELVATGAVAAVVLTALAVGGLVVSNLAIRKEQAHTQAAYQAETRRLAQARQAVDDMYTGVAERLLAKMPALTDLQRRFLAEARDFYAEFAREQAADPELRDRAADAYGRLGALEFGLDNLAPAEQAYGQEIALWAQLAVDFPGEAHYRARLANGHRQLGRVLYQRGATEAMGDHCREALRLATELVDRSPREPQYRLDLAVTYHALGLLAGRTGRHEAEYYQEALDVLRRLGAEFPERAPAYRSQLAATHFYLAGCSDRAKALEHYRGAIALQTRLVADAPDSLSDRGDLAFSHHNLGLLLYRAGDRSAAEPHFREAVRLRDWLADQFPNRPAYRVWSASSHLELGCLLCEERRLDAGKEHLGVSVRLRRGVAEGAPGNPDYRHKVANAYYDGGVSLTAGGDVLTAIAYYRQAVDVLRPLAAEFPRERKYLRLLCMALNNLAGKFADQGELAEARQLYEEVIGRQRGVLAALRDDRGYRNAVSNHFRGLAGVLVRLGEHAEAAHVVKELGGWFGGLRAYEAADIAVVLARCAALAENDDRLAHERRRTTADTYVARARDLMREAVRRTSADPGALSSTAWSLAVCPDPRVGDPAKAVELAARAVAAAPQSAEYWNTLGVARYSAGQWEAAVEALDKSVQLGEGGDAEDWLFLAMAHARLGHRGLARRHYDRAVRWRDEHRPHDDRLSPFLPEASALLGIPFGPAPATKEVKSAKS